MQNNLQANININTLNSLITSKKGSLEGIKKFIPDFEDVLANKRQMTLIELNKVAKYLNINMVSLYLTPDVYNKAYEYYRVIHQCKELEQKAGFMNRFGIHFTKHYDNLLVEKAKFCPYCGFELTA
jgi:hypothetical protein